MDKSSVALGDYHCDLRRRLGWSLARWNVFWAMRAASVKALSSLLRPACFCPGGPGGGQLLAPGTAKAGEPVNVSLRAVVRSSRSMCGGPAVDRFKSGVAYYWH